MPVRVKRIGFFSSSKQSDWLRRRISGLSLDVKDRSLALLDFEQYPIVRFNFIRSLLVFLIVYVCTNLS